MNLVSISSSTAVHTMPTHCRLVVTETVHLRAFTELAMNGFFKNPVLERPNSWEIFVNLETFTLNTITYELFALSYMAEVFENMLVWTCKAEVLFCYCE